MEVSYRVVNINQEANCMDVEYSAEGYEPVLVGVRIPLADENVDEIIKSFVPIGTWFPRTTELATVEAGHVGVMSVSTPLYADPAAAENMQMWMQVRFEQQVAKALVKFGVLQSDPTEIGVTQL